MTRNDLFLLLACAIAATVVSGSPSPQARSSSSMFAGLSSSMNQSEPALFQQALDHQ